MSMFEKDKDKDKDEKAAKHHPPKPDPDPPPVVAAQLSAAQQSWWQTYNAAAGGMFANQTYAALGRDYVHSQALAAAILAHGEYPPDEPPA